MVLFRTKPASIRYEDTLIFPGAQFLPDSLFDYLSNKYPDFARELKGGNRASLRVLVEPSKAVINESKDKGKTKAWPNAKTNIGEEVKALDEERAIEIVQEIIDEQELRDVQLLDTRRAVQSACINQWNERGSAMERLAPRSVTSPNRDVVNKPIFSTDDPVVREVVKDMVGSR